MPEAAEEVPIKAEVPPAKSKIPFILGGVIGLVIILAVVGVLWRRHRHSAPAAKASETTSETSSEESAPPQIVYVLHLENFVLNMGNPQQRVFLRLGIDLGLDKKPAEKEGAAMPVAQVRDTILTVVSANRPEELGTSEGKAKLKQDVLAALQQRLPELGIREVYLTDFLMQW